jgi:hypothetical protein
MNPGKNDVSLFAHEISGPAMYQSARLPVIADPRDKAARDRRDPVVVQAITIVAARQPREDWWALAPGVRTQAIYDEIRRLDWAWLNAAVVPVQEDADSPRYQMA